jgi:2-polyprenyl-6-methoxyphenol hydroxylase-like FAD-dependent oxidoreductase
MMPSLPQSSAYTVCGSPAEKATSMGNETHVQCCIAGGGPAGLMLAVLLARAGVRVHVLEKHPDFLRDFRGDTIHPSTMEIMSELGLLDEFLRLPHQKVHRLNGQFGEQRVIIGDFSHLPVKAPYIAMMPQWDFLDFLADEGRRYRSFSLEMQAEATGLIEAGGRVVGVHVATPEVAREVHADLVVGADGRGSILRAASGLKVEDLGAPMDALWFRLSRKPDDTDETQARFDSGRIFVMLNRGDYWQCAFVIAKGTLATLQAESISVFHQHIGAMLPFEARRAEEVQSWDDIKLLTVKVDRMPVWYREGLLFIGDAAHAMSPVGGVGVNLAVQDAVAAANRLAEPLRQGRVSLADLAAVQKRRTLGTRVIQGLQLALQNNVIAPALSSRDELRPPLFVRLMQTFPILRRLPARLFGLGVRPEHVADSMRRPRRDGA